MSSDYKYEGLTFAENEAANNISHQSLADIQYAFDVLTGTDFTEVMYFILPGKNQAFSYPVKKQNFLELLTEELGFRGEL